MENDQTDTPPSNAPLVPGAQSAPTTNNEPAPPQSEPPGTPLGPAPQVPPVISPPAGVETDKAMAPDSTFLTGSQIQDVKPKLPRGIYVIAGLTLLGVISGLFDDSQTGIIYTVSMIFSLLLVFGLVFRMELARKFMVGLSIFIVIISAASLLLLASLQNKFEQGQINYEAAVSKIDQSRITSKQKQQLDEMSATLASQSRQVGSALIFVYFKLGFTALVQIAVIVYLTRPKVKEVFEVAR